MTSAALPGTDEKTFETTGYHHRKIDTVQTVYLQLSLISNVA